MVFSVFLAFYLLCGMIVYFSSKKYGVGHIALLAISSRLVMALLGLLVVLPFGGKDAITFEDTAWEWSQKSITDILATINVSGSYVISSIIAFFYHIMERNLAIPVFLNAILGLFIFYYALVLVDVVWGQRFVSKLFVFIVALHPLLNINSAVVLRENYIILALLIASMHLAKFARNANMSDLLAFMLFIVLASFFHGGSILFILGLPVFFVFSNPKINAQRKIIASIFFLISGTMLLTYIDFGKISSLQDSGLDLEMLKNLEENRQDASTAYLAGMSPSSLYDVLWQAPLRFLFLIAKPFPWDIKEVNHLLVMFDAVLWWLIVYFLVRNWRAIKENPASFALLLSTAIVLAGFAYGTSNFGTGVRHRTKFLILMLVIVIPFLPRFKWNLPR